MNATSSPAGRPSVRRRLDAELVHRGLAASRRAAQVAVAEGLVTVDGVPADKPARLVAPGQALAVARGRRTFVSRAGLKLDGALDDFGLDPNGWRCLDAGASTGGFTDCLLQRGAASVVAVDVGTEQLHRRLRSDPRIISRERTDVRHLNPDAVGGPVDLVVADLSFISLRLVLGPLAALAGPGRPVVTLVKPQFEAGRAEAARGRGIIRDPAIWRRVLAEVVAAAEDRGLGLRAATVAGITGAGGNVEFVVWLSSGGPGGHRGDELLDRVVARAGGVGP